MGGSQLWSKGQKTSWEPLWKEAGSLEAGRAMTGDPLGPPSIQPSEGITPRESAETRCPKVPPPPRPQCSDDGGRDTGKAGEGSWQRGSQVFRRSSHQAPG